MDESEIDARVALEDSLAVIAEQSCKMIDSEVFLNLSQVAPALSQYVTNRELVHALKHIRAGDIDSEGQCVVDYTLAGEKNIVGILQAILMNVQVFGVDTTE